MDAESRLSRVAADVNRGKCQELWFKIRRLTIVELDKDAPPKVGRFLCVLLRVFDFDAFAF